MWGSGVNYLNTIPSYFSSKTGSKVLNLGETAWQSRQSLNELITLTGNGGYPDKVIFYDGVNDVAIGCRSDLKFVPSHHYHQLHPLIQNDFYQ